MFKATKSTIRATYANIYKCGYCAVRNLEYALGWRRIAYNAGVGGWNYHVLDLNDDTCILTGYRVDLGINIDCPELKDLNKRAFDLINEYDKDDAEKLRQDFAKFILAKSNS